MGLMNRTSAPLLFAAFALASAAPVEDARAQSLYLAEYKFNDPHLTRLAPDGTGATPLSVIPLADWLVVGLAVDQGNGHVYWTHGGFNQGAIRRANLDGTNVQTIVSGQKNARGLALDVTGGFVYWSDTVDNVIRRVRLDGTGLQTVASTGNQLGRPTLDLLNGKLWFGDLAAGTIHRANLDGTGLQTIVTGADDPAALALDLTGGKVYWVDAQTVTNHVARANLDGSNVQVLVQFPLASSGLIDIAVDPAGNALYFADEITVTEKGIWRAALDGSNATRIYASPSGWNAGALAFVTPVCTSETQTYGAGCNGSLSAPPVLTASACAVTGAPFTLGVENGLPSSTAFVFVGSAPASLPLGDGCTFLVSPVLPPLFPLPLDASGAGAVTLTIPSGALGAQPALQALVVDPAASLGFAATNGLRVTIE